MNKVDLVDTACSRLGLANDQRSRLTFAHSYHRCHSAPKAAPIEAAHQRKFCLTGEFMSCERFRAWQDETAAGRALLFAHVEPDKPSPGRPDETAPSRPRRRPGGTGRKRRADGDG